MLEIDQLLKSLPLIDRLTRDMLKLPPADFIPIQKLEHKITESDIKAELNDLKRELLHEENAATTDLRKNTKIYSKDWILKNLKIARMLDLENIIKLEKEKASKK